MIATLRGARANLPSAAAYAERNGGRAWDLLMKSEEGYEQLVARARVVGDEMNEKDPIELHNEQVFASVFERRATIVAEKIARLLAVGTIALDGDLGEGKGTVRERLRRAEQLMDGAKDAAQRERYAAQMEALRGRMLDVPLPHEYKDVSLRAMVKDLELWLHRQADAYRAMAVADRTAACVARGWACAPDFPNAWLASLPVDQQTLRDLGM